MNLEMYNLEKNLYEWYAKNIPTYGTFNFMPILKTDKWYTNYEPQNV